MAVTDLTDALPWWLRGGGPTGTPRGAPQGAVGGQPPPGVSSQAWLNYLANMFSPSSPAQADTLTQNQQLNALLAARTGGAPQPGPGDIPIGPDTIPPAAPATPAPPTSQSPTPWFTSGNTPMPWNGPNAPMPPPRPSPTAPNPNVPAPAAQPVSAAPSAVNPLATAGASGQLSTSNPRFGTVQYQNPNSVGNRAPIYTALNLGGLFGGGQRAAANPNAPAPNAQPMVGGPLASTGMSKAPWGMGPLQKGMVWPSQMGPFQSIADVASRSGYQ